MYSLINHYVPITEHGQGEVRRKVTKVNTPICSIYRSHLLVSQNYKGCMQKIHLLRKTLRKSTLRKVNNRIGQREKLTLNTVATEVSENFEAPVQPFNRILNRNLCIPTSISH